MRTDAGTEAVTGTDTSTGPATAAAAAARLCSTVDLSITLRKGVPVSSVSAVFSGVLQRL